MIFGLGGAPLPTGGFTTLDSSLASNKAVMNSEGEVSLTFSFR